MLNSRRIGLSEILMSTVMSLWCVPGPPVTGQIRPASVEDIPPTDYVARAKDLVRALYPGLNRDLVVTVHDVRPWWVRGVTNAFSLELSTYYDERKDPAGNPCQCEKLVLWASFGFAALDLDKRLMRFTVTDPTSESHEAALGELLRKHPEFSEEEAARAFEEAAGRYGPGKKVQLLRALPLSLLKPYIGTFTVTSAEWVRDASKDGNLQNYNRSPVCFWRVTGTSRLASGDQRDYTLVVDAFTGNLTSLIETP